MEISTAISDLLLTVCSTSEVTSPVAVGSVSVREHIIILNRPDDVLLFESIEIDAWGGVKESDVLDMGVEVVNETIDREEGKFGIGVGEVTAHGDQDMVALVVLMFVNNHIHQISYLLFSIVCLKSRICDNWVISVELVVKPESCGVAIVVIHRTSEDLHTLSQVIKEWSPHELHRQVFQSLFFILEVKPGKEPCVQAHICEESWICVGVAEGINVPADGWLNAKLFKNELLSEHHVVNHVLVDWAGFVVHGPASINNLKTSLLNKHFNITFSLVCLLRPPH